MTVSVILADSESLRTLVRSSDCVVLWYGVDADGAVYSRWVMSTTNCAVGVGNGSCVTEGRQQRRTAEWEHQWMGKRGCDAVERKRMEPCGTSVAV